MKIMRKNKTSAFLGDGQEEMRNCIRIIDNIKESEGHLNIIDDFIQSKNGEKNEKKINSNFKLEIFLLDIDHGIRERLLNEWATDEDILAIHKIIKPILERHLKELKRKLVDTGVEMAQQMKQEFGEQQVSA